MSMSKRNKPAVIYNKDTEEFDFTDDADNDKRPVTPRHPDNEQDHDDIVP